MGFSKKSLVGQFTTAAAILLALTSTSNAASYDITIDGSDAIWLAGRTDLTIPDASQSWSDGMIRHSGNTPEEIKETLPPGVSVTEGDVLRVLDPAIGGISYFNGLGEPYYGPEGNAGNSDLSSFGGISAYSAPRQGALVGVFLNDSVPMNSPPSFINYYAAGMLDQAVYTPLLGQVFYIGDGENSSNVMQQFIAPTGATRVFFGIPDGFGFNGAPGAYDDNDGAYRISVGVNQIPDNPVPEPTTMLLFGTGIAGLAAIGRKRRK